MIIIVFAFICLGFLIGNLVGLSAQSTVAILIPLLFTFGGGSAVAFLPSLDAASRKLAAAAVIALSLSCLIGLYTGIIVSERQLLSSQEKRASSLSARTSIADRKYLRAIDMREVDVIDQRQRNNDISVKQAYEQLYELAKKGETK